MGQTLTLGKLVIIAAAIGWLLHHTGMPEELAIMFAIVISFVEVALFELWEFANFKPYKIVVGVAYNHLLAEDCIKKDLFANYDEIVSSIPYKSFEIAAISRTVFALSNHGYRSEMFIYDSPFKGLLVWPGGVGSAGEGPLFYLKRARGGYEIGIKFKPEWLEQESVANSYELLTEGGKSMPKAFIPDDYFPKYILWWNSPTKLFELTERKKKKAIAKIRKQGWQVSEDDPELISNGSIEIRMSML
jgi:hypothetical protein